MDKKIPFCSYYGRLHGKLLGHNVAGYILDQQFKEVIDKNQLVLEEKQRELLRNFKKSFQEFITPFKKFMKKTDSRLSDIEKKLRKPKKVKIKTIKPSPQGESNGL